MEFRRFLATLDKEVPDELAVHLVCDTHLDPDLEPGPQAVCVDQDR